MSGDQAGAALARYDQDEAFRARVIALYLGNRPQFIASVISLAAAEGFGRAESVAFAKAVCARVRAEAERIA